MDGQQAEQAGPEPQPANPQELATDPAKHFWATVQNNFTMGKAKAHTCNNFEQRGNYLHCLDGNHGFRLAPDEILSKDANGNFRITKMTVIDTSGLQTNNKRVTINSTEVSSPPGSRPPQKL